MFTHKLKATSQYNVDYLGKVFSPTDSTTFTFSSVDLGIANILREIFICFLWTSAQTRNVSSVTIGGVTASQVTYAASSGSGQAIYRAAVPSGTTGNIVITFSGTCTALSVSIFRSIGRTRYTQAATNVSNTVPLAGTSSTITLPIQANGFAIGMMSGTVGDYGTVSSNYFDLVDSFSYADGTATSRNYVFMKRRMRAPLDTSTKTVNWTISRAARITFAAFD